MLEDWSGSILYFPILLETYVNFPMKISKTKVGRKPLRSLPTRFFIFKSFFLCNKDLFHCSLSFLYGAAASVTFTVTVTFFDASERFWISKVAAALAGNGPVGKSFAF